jgi:acyl-CoA synthetase (AMP-forming)/AMP-acid ligase II
MAYRPHLYAGLQVVMQALLNRGTLVIPPVDATPEEVAHLMASSQTEYVSATPSYWRRLLLLVPPGDWNNIPLKQITLGGEVVDQSILDQLATTFPTARIAHIYATTEVGRCFSVTDGLAGFPTSFLSQSSADGIQLKVDDSQLWVRSENAMTAYDAKSDVSSGQFVKGQWFPTGDLVEVHDDRVCFVGRRSDMINVGGNKVHPVEVEQVIRELDGIAEVRVYPQSSSLAGQLVACDVVTTSDTDPKAMRQRVIQHCHQRLNRYQCPRVVQIVDRLDLSAAGKMKRSS